MLYLLYLIVITALVCLTLFQTNRSIYIRSAGLFLILAAELVLQFQLKAESVPRAALEAGASFSTDPNLILIVLMAMMLVLGFASDYYSATLRTWYFRVSDEAIWGLMIGGFIACPIMFILFPTILVFLVFCLLGAMIGELRSRGFRSLGQIVKATIGTFAGVFGMATKLLLGIEMAYWFVNFR